MAPGKFGLFKARSRDQPEQPSTENLLKSSTTTVNIEPPDSPQPSTSKGIVSDNFFAADIFSALNLDDDDEIIEDEDPLRRASLCSDPENNQMAYQNLHNPSTGTSTFTLEDEAISTYEPESINEDEASTTHDANSIQYDASSLNASVDESLYCTVMNRPKKSRSKEQQLTDLDMWQASNVEVIENLLNRTGTLDEQIKWEAIATSRGLCTLTDSCTCSDCTGVTYLAGVTDGDGGLGVAPLFSAISMGCLVQ